MFTYIQFYLHLRLFQRVYEHLIVSIQHQCIPADPPRKRLDKIITHTLSGIRKQHIKKIINDIIVNAVSVSAHIASYNAKNPVFTKPQYIAP